MRLGRKLRRRKQANYTWSLALLMVNASLAFLLSGRNCVSAANGEGFFELSFSDATNFLDVTAVDPDTLLPIPSTFTADVDGVYQLSALLIQDGDTASPVGRIDFSGREDGQFEFVSELAVAGGPENNLAFFAGLIVGIEIEDIDVEEARIVSTSLQSNANGSAGTPPANGSLFHSTFMGTPDGKEARVDGAGGGGTVPIPGSLVFDTSTGEVPPLPSDTASDRFNIIIGQTDYAIFDIPINADFTVTATSSILLLAPAKCPDFDGDGDVDGDDFLAWQANFGLSQGATKMQGDADGDGDVDGDDFLIWQADFGAASGGAQVEAVAEPASLLLGALAVALAGYPRRRRIAATVS